MEPPSSPASVRACHDALTAAAAQHAAPCVSARPLLDGHESLSGAGLRLSAEANNEGVRSGVR